jgi:hypothetical protein
VIPGANHFFDARIEPLMGAVSVYLDKRLASVATRPEPRGRRTG